MDKWLLYKRSLVYYVCPQFLIKIIQLGISAVFDQGLTAHHERCY